MNRKTFIIGLAAATVAIPIVYKYNGIRKKFPPLEMPQILGQFCDESEIRKIGATYCHEICKEHNKEKIIDLLLTNDKGEKLNLSENEEIQKLVNKKVQKNFIKNQTVVVDGWIISVTEADQCALFSLLTSS